MSDPNIEFYNRGFESGAKYVLEYLADLYEGVEDTDVWKDFFGNDKEDND